MGRRYVAILGASFLILGMIVASTAHSMNIFIGEILKLLLIWQSDAKYRARRNGNLRSWCWHQ